MLIIITGNPGTGKHTVSKILAKKFGMDLVDVNRVAVSQGFASKNKGVLEVDTKKLKGALAGLIKKDMLLVGHLAPYVVSSNKVKSAIVLRRSPYSLERTYKKRGYTKKKAVENLGAEILGVTYYDTVKNFGQKKTFQFDTTDDSVAATVRKISSLIRGSRTRGENIDWLKTISRKGDLKRFFPY